MYGKKRVEIIGEVTQATLLWNGNTPVKHPLIGGILTAPCVKNGEPMAARLNFDVMIRDNSKARGGKGYKIENVSVFSSINAEPGKGHAELISRLIVPGRSVKMICDEEPRRVELFNDDGTPVLRNGIQVKQLYINNVLRPGEFSSAPKDTVDVQIAMSDHHQKISALPADMQTAWDFFWRPLSVSYDAHGKATAMSDENKAIMAGVNKARNAMPLLQEMVSYGYALVRTPAGAVTKAPSLPQYKEWLGKMIQLGVLRSDGLPHVAPKADTIVMPNQATPAAATGAVVMPTVETEVAGAVDTAVINTAVVTDQSSTGLPVVEVSAGAQGGETVVALP